MSDHRSDPGKSTGGKVAHDTFREVAKMNLPNKAQTPAKCSTFAGRRTGSVYGKRK